MFRGSIVETGGRDEVSRSTVRLGRKTRGELQGGGARGGAREGKSLAGNSGAEESRTRAPE